jgi:hypothetical protein
LHIIFFIDTWGGFSGENHLNLAGLQVQVMLAGVAVFQGVFQAVKIYGQGSHGYNYD